MQGLKFIRAVKWGPWKNIFHVRLVQICANNTYDFVSNMERKNVPSP